MSKISAEEILTKLQSIEFRLQHLESIFASTKKTRTLKVKSRTNAIKKSSHHPRLDAINQVISLLQQHNPTLNVTKGTRPEGHLILSNPVTRKKLTVKVFTSTNFKKEKNYPFGWTRVTPKTQSDLSTNLFIFSVKFNDTCDNSWVFTNQEFHKFLSSKPKDIKGNQYMCLTAPGNGTWEVRNGKRDAQPYFQRWSLPSQLI